MHLCAVDPDAAEIKPSVLLPGQDGDAQLGPNFDNVAVDVFKAPLTATLLIFELTRGYEIVLPLLAAAGTGPLVVEWSHRRERRRLRTSA